MDSAPIADAYNILVVDDDPSVVMLLGRILEDFGCIRTGTNTEMIVYATSHGHWTAWCTGLPTSWRATAVRNLRFSFQTPLLAVDVAWRGMRCNIYARLTSRTHALWSVEA
jgi:CheY-like chemotaxis protein